jgi:phosphatidylglycerol:prolipoprotein diacylglycerol transferase
MTNSPISFPGLFGDWEFTASEVALDIGKGIYWYGIIIAVGVLAATALCLRLRHRFGVSEDNILDVVLMGVPVSIVGARAYYVIFYLDLYRTADGGIDWGRAIAIWDGGIAIYGAVIAAVIVAYLYCRRKKVSFGALGDVCVIGLLVGQSIGRWGNFMNREAFGGETTLPWRMRLVLETGEFIEVHPTFLYESLWNLAGILLLVLVFTPRRRFDGQNVWTYFLWYGLGRVWIEGLRTDSLYLFDWALFGEPIRVSQALSATMILVSAAALIWNLAVRHPSAENLYVNQNANVTAEDAAVQEGIEKENREESEQ